MKKLKSADGFERPAPAFKEQWEYTDPAERLSTQMDLVSNPSALPCE